MELNDGTSDGLFALLKRQKASPLGGQVSPLSPITPEPTVAIAMMLCSLVVRYHRCLLLLLNRRSRLP